MSLGLQATKRRMQSVASTRKITNAMHLVATSKFKPVINVDTGNKYTSLKMAEKETGINKMCISNVCRGKQKTAGGYHWKFLNN